MLSIFSSFVFASSIDYFGWGYNVTGPDTGLVNLTYNYTSLLPWVNNEIYLDLFNWNNGWERTYATLDTTANTLITEQDSGNFPILLVMGEINSTTWLSNYSSVYGGTNLNLESDLTDVSNLILSNGQSQIQWSNSVNLLGTDLTNDLKIGNGFVSLNVNNIHSSLNSAATIPLTVAGCDATRVYYNSNFQTSFTPGSNGWNLIDCSSNPTCTIVSCSSNTLTLQVTNFDGWGGEGDPPLPPSIPEFNFVGLILIVAVAGTGMYLISRNN